MSETAGPVTAKQRYESLDVLRGVAVLGILMMNVQAFAMHPLAYQYPPAHMGLEGANGLAWLVSHVFFELKFITIFSALFGAGIVLMNGQERGRTPSVALHERRMIWLLLIGLIHAYVFWFGDVLVPYAIMGLIVVRFRHMGPAKLIGWAVFWIVLSGLLMTGLFASTALAPDDFTPADMGMAPTPEDLQAWIAAYQSGFADRIPRNALMALFGQLMSLTLFAGRLVGVMFLGMALYKLGFLTLGWSARAYAIGAVLGLAVGLAPIWQTGSHALEAGFPLDETWLHAGVNYVFSLAVAFGYACAVMLACKAGALRLARAPFAAAGRMAFTNYLTQTLVMTVLMVGGIGLGLFGELERVQQVQLVIVVWIAQLVISVLWLSVFRYGPFEWAWRSLTYRRVMAIRKRAHD